MRASRPKPLDAALGAVLHELGLGQRIHQLKVLDLWPDVVGQQIAKVTQADRIDRGKLTVRVSTAAWRNELVFLKKQIIVKLNQAIGDEIVKDIVFR